MRAEEYLREGECLHDLQRGGFFIIQPEKGFRFCTDSVLLADFCRPRRKDRVADMGTGSGVIPLLLCARVPEIAVDAFEISEPAADRARRSAELNGLSHAIRVHTADLRDAPRIIGHETMSLVVTNPPYLQPGEGLVSPDPERALARGGTETLAIKEWVAACSSVLKNGGRFAAVFPAAGFLRLSDAMRQAEIEPKKVRFVATTPDRPPKLFLIEGIKRGGRGLSILPVLYTHEKDGYFSPEMRRIYGEEPENTPLRE